MNISNKKKLDDFVQSHSRAVKPLNKWLNKVNKENWKNLADIRKCFRTANYVGNERYVFDISGNNFRLVAVVLFLGGILDVRFIGTHADYDKIKKCSEL